MTRILLTIVWLAVNAFSQVPTPIATGNGFFEIGRYAEAAAAYESLPEIERTASVWNRLAMSYHMANRSREAEAAYKRALRMDVAFAPAYNNLGSLYYFQHKFGDADGQFRRAAEQDAASEVIRRNLRATRYARENSRTARIRATELVKIRPFLVEERYAEYLGVASLLPTQTYTDALNFERRGDAFLARKMYDDAIIEYRKSIALDPYNASVVNRLGIAYHQAQKLREADQQYREALKLNPAYLQALNNRGTIEYSRGNFLAALDQYRKALRLQPESTTVLLNVGACLFEMGPERYEEGVRAYQQALALDPALFERAAATTGAGTLIQMTQRANPMMNFHLARIFAERGNADLAISYLYRAVEAGFKDAKMLKDERAFLLLAADERFARLLETMTVAGS